MPPGQLTSMQTLCTNTCRTPLHVCEPPAERAVRHVVEKSAHYTHAKLACNTWLQSDVSVCYQQFVKQLGPQ